MKTSEYECIEVYLIRFFRLEKDSNYVLNLNVTFADFQL